MTADFNPSATNTSTPIFGAGFGALPVSASPANEELKGAHYRWRLDVW
ncbi:MAG: hypothetical protein ABI595_15770 [Actinomycetota bacterium]